MNTRKIALALAAGTTLFAAAPAFAHGWHEEHRHHHYYYPAPAYVYYPARPVVVAPPPYSYYFPAPAPVIYGSFPVAPGVRVSVGARL